MAKVKQLEPAEARILAREVNRLLRESPEIVLELNDIADFLSNGELPDDLDTLHTLGSLAARHGWRMFVFDYGARVRIAAASRSRPRSGETKSANAR
jgi:hypothetical protein